MLSSVLLLSLWLSSSTPQLSIALGIPNAVLSGMVTDRAGRPISGAEVRLIKPETGEIISVRSDENGRYRFAMADPTADYTLAVRRLGFAPQTMPGMRVGAPENEVVSFSLDSLKFKPSVSRSTGRKPK